MKVIEGDEVIICKFAGIVWLKNICRSCEIVITL